MLKLAQLLTKSPQQLSTTYKPQFKYSTVDRMLNKLQKPLYFYLIGLNVGVFALWHIPVINKSLLYDHFTLSKTNISELRLHTLLTYSISHYNVMHILFNMVTLYFFGRTIEAHFGPKRLLYLYLLGALVGGIMQYKSSYFGGVALGASAAVNALLTYYICNFPREIIILFILPVPAWVVGILLLYQSWAGSGQGGSIGHSAHLGGILAGAGYYLATRGRI